MTEDVRTSFSNLTTLSRAVKAKCLDCCNGQRSEVDNCTVKMCPLYNFRKGRYAFKPKKEYTEEQRATARERLLKTKAKKENLTEA